MTLLEFIQRGQLRLQGTLRFIDLYAGLGGIHQALSTLGHRCVFASEIEEDLAKLYENVNAEV